MKKVLLLYVLLISCAIHGQVVPFTQVFSNAQYMNPAFTGLYHRANLHYHMRLQNPDNNTYMTHLVSYDQDMAIRPFTTRFHNSGMGFMYVNDNFNGGAYTNQMARASFSFNRKINRNVNFSIGANVDYNIESYQTATDSGAIDNFRAYPVGSYDEAGTGSKQYLNGGFGLLIFGDKFFAGAAVNQVFKTNTRSTSGSVQLGYMFREGYQRYLRLKPSLVYRFNGSNHALLVDFQTQYLGMFLDVNYSTLGSVGAGVGYTVEYFHIGYNLDYYYGSGMLAHEASISFRIPGFPRTHCGGFPDGPYSIY